MTRFSRWFGRVTLFVLICAISLIGFSGCRNLGSSDESGDAAGTVFQLSGEVFEPEGVANVTAANGKTTRQG